MSPYAPKPIGHGQYAGANPRVGRNLRVAAITSRLAPLGVLIALLAGLGLLQPSFLSFYSLTVLAGESSAILVLAAGQTLAILLGGIDLSMAAIASLASVLIALVLPSAGVAGLVGVLALTTAIGAAQGFVYARAQLPSFVVTLAGLGLWSGAALVIGRTTIPVSAGYEAVGWLRGRSFNVSNAFVFAIGMVAALIAMLRWFPIGRHIYAIGMGEVAAVLSGVRVARVKVMVFALSGLFAGFAGMVMVARTYGGNPTIADSLLLPSIAAVVVWAGAPIWFGWVLIGAICLLKPQFGLILGVVLLAKRRWAALTGLALVAAGAELGAHQ